MLVHLLRLLILLVLHIFCIMFLPLTKGESAEQSRHRALMRSRRQQDQPGLHCKKRQRSANCFNWLLYVVVLQIKPPWDCLVYSYVFLCILMYSYQFVVLLFGAWSDAVMQHDATILIEHTVTCSMLMKIKSLCVVCACDRILCVLITIACVLCIIFDILLVCCPPAQGWRHDRYGACAECKLAVSRQAEFHQARC